MCFLENNLLLRFLPSMMQVGENVGCKGVKTSGFLQMFNQDFVSFVLENVWGS